MGGVTPDPPRPGEGDRATRGGGGVRQLRRPEVTVARKLRREMSLPEVLLWQRLRGESAGVKFRRQHPIGPYVVDFYAGVARLVVEIDGMVHDFTCARDGRRNSFLRDNGYQLLHVNAADVLKNPDRVAEAILSHAVSPLHQPAAGPLPRAGEDQA